ncbi:hypothetical protein ACVIU7_006462 [Bradyrhizobium liaoningense]|nr:hypothetical protein GCM10007858_16390 [Bradyrhizobium liaoningense]
MIVADEEIVGWIEVDPAELGPAPERHPGMGGVGALQRGWPGGGIVRSYPLT